MTSIKYLIGKIVKKPYKVEEVRYADARFNEGIFCAWNGEPLWLLEDYETTNDIEDLC